MTTGEQLVDISTLTTGTAIQHLMNPSGEGGGGVDTYVPMDIFTCSLDTNVMSADLSIEELSSDLIQGRPTADFITPPVLEADITQNLEGDL